ncbi:unnamed protein product, partial [Aphanomyces euteiches]
YSTKKYSHMLFCKHCIDIVHVLLKRLKLETIASTRRAEVILRQLATKPPGTPFFSTPDKATHEISVQVPSKIEEIIADSNYVALTYAPSVVSSS